MSILSTINEPITTEQYIWIFVSACLMTGFAIAATVFHDEPRWKRWLALLFWPLGIVYLFFKIIYSVLFRKENK